MSITVAVDTVVGVKFEKKDLFETKILKAFKHNYPDTMKFCPETGKKLWETDDWSPKFQGLNKGDDRFAGLKLVHGPVVYENSNWDYKTFYAGKSFEANGYQDNKKVSFIAEKDIMDIKKEVKAKLEPLGLWNEDNFGIWTVLYVG